MAARTENENLTTAGVRAILIEPATMAVLWTNRRPEAAAAAEEARPPELDELLPMAAALGVPEAVRSVARTGAPEHLRADVIKTARGNLGLDVAVHRLPDGAVLLLAEEAWHVRSDSRAQPGERRSGAGRGRQRRVEGATTRATAGGDAGC